VEQAIRYLQANFQSQPSLEEAAASVHLSKYHFQRLFKHWAGISPTQFVHYLSLEYAKQQLAASRSVLDASLDTGLSGPGRLHDLFVTIEGVTPGEYKRGGDGLHIDYGIHDSPFGPCLLATTARGICGLHFVNNDDIDEVLQKLAADWPRATRVENPSQTGHLAARLFDSAPLSAGRPFHLLLRGTNFQINVWRALLKIPSGRRVSYADLAAYLGKPTASRAIGSAIARNPVAYLIPCHRVIRRTGDTHAYRWGNTRKQAMLAWEAAAESLAQ
jgi:AraC family transcriptional regulator of adaptative response/methylated-DNA-[protein]-cysteine methyltransferase